MDKAKKEALQELLRLLADNPDLADRITITIKPNSKPQQGERQETQPRREGERESSPPPQYKAQGIEIQGEFEMRFIDRRNCKSAFEKGESREIKSMGALTQEAVKIAEQNGLGVMQNRSGAFRVIRACGLGAYENFFSSLEEVDAFIKNLKK